MSIENTISTLYSSIQGSLIIIGVVYLISISLLKKISVVNVGIYLGVVLLFFINNLVVVPLIIGAVNVVQGIYLLYKKELKLGLKNLSFGYFFILMAIPDSVNIIAAGLVLIFSIKFLTISFEQEINDPILYFSNVVVAAVSILKFQQHITNVGLLSALLMLLIAFSILRFITSPEINTTLYILPQLLCASVLVPPVYVALVVIYIFVISTMNITKNKAVHLLDLLPYIDGTLFPIIVYSLVTKYGFKYSLGVGIVLFVLLLISSMKSFERYFKEKKNQDWSKLFVSLFFSAIIVVFLPAIMENKFKLLQPIPVFLSIILIFIEGKYISIFSRTKIISISVILSKIFSTMYRIFYFTSAFIYKLFVRTKDLMVIIIKNVIYSLMYFVDIIPRLFIFIINKKPNSKLYKKINETINKGEVYFLEVLKLEDLVSIAIIIILLMYYLGDF